MGVVIRLSFEAVRSFKMRYLVGLISFLWILNSAYAKDGKLLPFQIIKFPNDPCDASGTKNGTCYTTKNVQTRVVHLLDHVLKAMVYVVHFQLDVMGHPLKIVHILRSQVLQLVNVHPKFALQPVIFVK